jgi:hypothetical protein
MRKQLLLACFLLFSTLGFSQSIGHFQQLATVKRGDTLDVAWYYQPSGSVDIRTFQVDFQFKKHLLTFLTTSIDTPYVTTARQPQLDYRQFNNYKYDTYSNGSYAYAADTNWAVGRNYLTLPAGTGFGTNNGYIIHNKYKINSVASNFVSDTITVNWARLFRVDGTSIGDNVATLTNKKLAIFLQGNLTISGKIWMGEATGLPTIIAYDNNTGIEASRTVPAANGTYTLTNIEQNTKYKIKVLFSRDSLITMRDRAVTVADAVKTYNEFKGADINQAYPRTFLTNGLAYLIADVNRNGQLDGGDPYGIYASVSGLLPVDTARLVNVFLKNEFDSLAIGANQWTAWASNRDKGLFIYDSVTTVNSVNVDIKYMLLGDVDRSHSSPVFNAQGQLVARTIYRGDINVNIPDTYVNNSQPLFVPFNVSYAGYKNTGLQFEMKYDPAVVRFDQIQSNIDGPWLQYVTNDSIKGIVRFGGMNNQDKGFLTGDFTPYKLKFSPKNPGTNITSFVYVRRLMDAADENGDHYNIVLQSDRIVLSYRMNGSIPTYVNMEPTIAVNPNPTTGQFEVVVYLPKNTNMNALVYDMQGRKIMDLGKFETKDTEFTFRKPVSSSNIPAGMYNLVLFDNRKRITTKLIKS